MLSESLPRDLDPVHAADAASQKINNLLHASLVRFSSSMALEGELASSWETKSYRKFHFRLREGLRFEDGQPLKASDVLRSFEEFRNLSPAGVAFERVTRAWVDGDRDVWFETKIPQPFLLSDFPAIKVFKRAGKRLIGAGRYRLAEESPTELRLAISETYFEPIAPGSVRDLHIRHVNDDTTRYQLLLRGDGNIIYNALSLTKEEHLRQHLPEGLQMVDAPGVLFSYLCFNFRDPRLANLKVRQAIAHAIDIDSILKYRIGGYAYRATGILAPAHKDYYEPEVERYGFDRARAEQLLDEAGYPRTGPGRWRFELSFKTTPEKFGNEMARVLADQMQSVGIKVRLETVEQGTFFADIKAGNFQLFHSRWIGVTAPSIYFRAFHSSQAGNLNRGAYANAEMDALIDKGMVEVDDRKRRNYFSAVQKLAARDLPYLNLWHWNITFIGTTRMRNVVIYPNADFRTFTDLRMPF